MQSITFRTFVLVSVMTSLLLPGCKKHTPKAPEAPVVTFESSVKEVPAAGGVFQITYTIANPVEGETLSASCAESWISDIKTDVKGTISFTVAANEASQAREAVIAVSYAGIKPAPSFSVKQLEAGEAAAPAIKLEKEEVEVGAEGAACKLSYELVNPVEGNTVSARCEAEWVTDLSLDTEGQITFNVAANESAEPRKATVLLDYGKDEALAEFEVSQQGKGAAEEAFKVTVSDVKSTSFVVNAVPGDKEMDYLLNVIPAKAAEGMSDDDLYKYDVDFYSDMDAGAGWESVAREYLVRGDIKDKTVENMKPQTEYLVYAYGVDPATIERRTPITRVKVSTLAPETVKADFNIELASVEGLEIKAEVAAEGYDGYFKAGVFSNFAEGDSEETLKEKIQAKWADDVQLYGWMGYSVDMILTTYASKDKAELHETLEPNKTYCIYAFALDASALCCSQIRVLKITTDGTTVVK